MGGSMEGEGDSSMEERPFSLSNCHSDRPAFSRERRNLRCAGTKAGPSARTKVLGRDDNSCRDDNL